MPSPDERGIHVEIVERDGYYWLRAYDGSDPATARPRESINGAVYISDAIMESVGWEAGVYCLTVEPCVDDAELADHLAAQGQFARAGLTESNRTQVADPEPATRAHTTGLEPDARPTDPFTCPKCGVHQEPDRAWWTNVRLRIDCTFCGYVFFRQPLDSHAVRARSVYRAVDERGAMGVDQRMVHVDGGDTGWV